MSDQSAGIVYRAGKDVLLMRRKDNGYWSLPAGHVENGETPRDAAYREFNEETGKDLGTSVFQSINNSDLAPEFHAFQVSGEKFDPTMNHEHDSYVWANLGDLPQPLHPGLETMLKGESEQKNATQEPRTFYARHMQPGTCGYENETILVDSDALKKLIASAKDRGIPVYIHHNDDDKQTRLANLRDQACGFVTDSFYNELDGWAWFKFLAVEDEAHKAIQNGWSVSNAYVPHTWGAGGTKNNCPYQREVVDGEFTHLAIVPNPRYEKACIMTPEQFKAYQDGKRRELEELRNSNGNSEGNKKMKIKFFARKEVEATEATANTELEFQNAEGKTETATIGEMVAALSAEKQNKGKKNEADMGDAEVECDGEKMKVSELVNRFTTMKKNAAKQNADDDEAKKKKDEEEKENAAMAKKNAEEKAEKDKAEEEEKKNSGHFAEISNAAVQAAQQNVRVVETATDGVQRGKDRYGKQTS